MLNFSTIMIGTHQPKVLADFYKEVFEQEADMVDGDWHGWKAGNTFFTIGEHSEVNGEAKEPQRIMLNFETNKVKEEFDRIKDIEGCTIIKEPYEMESMWIATLADPDGNYFQLATPWNSN